MYLPCFTKSAFPTNCICVKFYFSIVNRPACIVPHTCLKKYVKYVYMRLVLCMVLCTIMSHASSKFPSQINEYSLTLIREQTSERVLCCMGKSYRSSQIDYSTVLRAGQGAHFWSHHSSDDGHRQNTRDILSLQKYGIISQLNSAFVVSYVWVVYFINI